MDWRWLCGRLDARFFQPVEMGGQLPNLSVQHLEFALALFSATNNQRPFLYAITPSMSRKVWARLIRIPSLSRNRSATRAARIPAWKPPKLLPRTSNLHLYDNAPGKLGAFCSWDWPLHNPDPCTGRPRSLHGRKVSPDRLHVDFILTP